jgi:hypothetical protein
LGFGNSTAHQLKGEQMGKRIGLGLVAALLWTAAPVQAALITWTLQDVIFDDGGTATGFVTFDPTIPFLPDLYHRQYLSRFDIKTTAGTQITAPFEYTPANTDAYVPYYISFFSAPESSGPRHGLPQHILHLSIRGRFPATGGTVEIFPDASRDVFNLGDRIIARSIVSGSLNGVIVPEPGAFAFLGIALVIFSASRASGFRRCRKLSASD